MLLRCQEETRRRENLYPSLTSTPFAKHSVSVRLSARDRVRRPVAAVFGRGVCGETDAPPFNSPGSAVRGTIGRRVTHPRNHRNYRLPEM